MVDVFGVAIGGHGEPDAHMAVEGSFSCKKTHVFMGCSRGVKLIWSQAVQKRQHQGQMMGLHGLDPAQRPYDGQPWATAYFTILPVCWVKMSNDKSALQGNADRLARVLG